MYLGPGLVAFIVLMVLFIILAVYLLKVNGTEGWVAPVLVILFGLICLFPLITTIIAQIPRKKENVKIDHRGVLRVMFIVLSAFFALLGYLFCLYFRVVHNPHNAQSGFLTTTGEGQPENDIVRVWRVPLHGTVADRDSGKKKLVMALKKPKIE